MVDEGVDEKEEGIAEERLHAEWGVRGEKRRSLTRRSGLSTCKENEGRRMKTETKTVARGTGNDGGDFTGIYFVHLQVLQVDNSPFLLHDPFTLCRCPKRQNWR